MQNRSNQTPQAQFQPVFFIPAVPGVFVSFQPMQYPQMQLSTQYLQIPYFSQIHFPLQYPIFTIQPFPQAQISAQLTTHMNPAQINNNKKDFTSIFENHIQRLKESMQSIKGGPFYDLLEAAFKKLSNQGFLETIELTTAILEQFECYLYFSEEKVSTNEINKNIYKLIHLIRALAYFYQKDINAANALNDINIAINTDISYALSHQIRAEINLFLSCNETAISDATTALESNPTNIVAYLIRAKAKNLLAQKGKMDFSEALKDANAAISISEDCYIAYYQRAVIKYHMGDLNGAIQDATVAGDDISCDSDVFLAKIYFEQKTYACARIQATAAIKKNSKNILAYEIRKKTYEIKNQFDLALLDEIEIFSLKKTKTVYSLKDTVKFFILKNPEKILKTMNFFHKDIKDSDALSIKIQQLTAVLQDNNINPGTTIKWTDGYYKDLSYFFKKLELQPTKRFNLSQIKPVKGNDQTSSMDITETNEKKRKRR